MEILKQEHYKEYEDFVQSHPKGHFMQSRLWAGVKNSWKWEAVVERDAEGRIIGSMAILIRKVPGLPASILYSPRGPVCDVHDRAVLESLLTGARELAKKHRGYVLKLDPDVSSSDTEFASLMEELGFHSKSKSKNFEGIQPRFVFRLYPEGRSEEEIMASFHQKTRYNIRVAVKKGVTVKIEGPEALPDFHRIMLETGVRDGFMIRSEGYFRQMMDCLGEHVRLYMAYWEGQPVAGTLCMHYGDKVWYLYGASSNESRNVMPNYLLQWEMIRWALEKGCRVYDFRGVSGDLSEDNPLYGLYRFKKGYNGEFTEFVGELDLVLNRPLYLAVEKGEPIFRKLRKYVFLLKNRGKIAPHAPGAEPKGD